MKSAGVALAVLLVGCAGTPSAPPRPGPPPVDYRVMIQWDPVTVFTDQRPINEPVTYTLDYVTADGTHQTMGAVRPPIPLSLAAGTYGFRIQAVTATHGVSGYSAEVSKTVP